jgi:hypothetical protein
VEGPGGRTKWRDPVSKVGTFKFLKKDQKMRSRLRDQDQDQGQGQEGLIITRPTKDGQYTIRAYAITTNSAFGFASVEQIARSKIALQPAGTGVGGGRWEVGGGREVGGREVGGK